MRKGRVKPWLSPRKDNVDSKRDSVEYEKHSIPLIAAHKLQLMYPTL